MAQIKSYDTLSDVKEHVKRGRLLSEGATLTPSATGVITVTDSYHLVAVATGDTDDVQTVNSEVTAQAGQIVVLQPAVGGEDIVIKKYVSGADNIRTVTDVTLAEATDTITLMWNGSGWNMLASASAAVPS